MIYLTHTRLMRESERIVHDTATDQAARERSVCDQLIASEPRYTLWHTRQEQRMTPIAKFGRREWQILELRRAGVEQLHRAALVRYLRDFRVTGVDRDVTLRHFYSVVDSREAAIREHRSYLVAASSQLCAAELLALAGDEHGVDLLRRYELAYAQYFSLFCQRARAIDERRRFLLGDLVPEVKGVATRLREQIVGGHLLPTRTSVPVHGLRVVRARVVRARVPPAA